MTDWDLKDYQAAILCGGRSLRMGRDKAFLKDKNGRLLLAASAETLAGIFKQVHFITNEPAKLAPYPDLTAYPVWPDLHPLSGPAGAIRTALKALPGQTVFILAGDQPVINASIIKRLAALMAREEADIALPRRGQAIEPLYAFYGPKAEPVLAESLDRGRLAIRQSFPLLRTVYLELRDEEIFQNLNTPAEASARGFTLPP
ncbi:MAG: molybdenum cofactor guanylyltransferase [Deltaproteobacteria bacterium]|jgi:molybdopterin-guanine dinucleotide biosynthesis protein A|nr:molybdenum cofactor guanylyltransferase [Deltaproteobacteria bacterium]